MSDPADHHPLWLGETPLVLASSSRTRFALLVEAGIPVQVAPAVINERAIEAPLLNRGVAPRQIALSLAREKALAVSSTMPDRWVLGADQGLACDGVHLHKPVDREDAAKQLVLLSGRMHHLYSAAALVRNERVVTSFVVSARLTMRSLSAAMIAVYLDTAGDSVKDSVGGYQLEKVGIHLFQRVVGDQSTILGLPMLQTLAHLRKLDLVIT